MPTTQIYWGLLPALLLSVVLLAGTYSESKGQVEIWPERDWVTTEPANVGMDKSLLVKARDYALSAGGSGMIVRHGKVVMRWGDQKQLYDIKSATKSFGATMLGIAIREGKIQLDAPASDYHPALGVPPKENAKTGWLDGITILHLATQTAGFEKPGGYEKLLFKPGTQWHYSDGGPNWLAECITLAYGEDLQDVMFDRVFTRIGISREDLRWRNNQYRDHTINRIPRREFGAGIHANVEALSRLGYLYLRRGKWKDEQILTEAFVRTASQPIKSVVGLREWEADGHGNASDHYSLLWWNNGDSSLEQVPPDAFWAWGLYDSLVIVIPSLDLVVVRGGARGRNWPRSETADHYAVLGPFLNPIVKSIGQQGRGAKQGNGGTRGDSAPYPLSELITGIEWAPRDSIIRLAEGSDNWPITWADDNQLYTAYGDGWGFKPKTEEKLSLGLARITGVPPEFEGENIRSAEAEQSGQGAQGMKASGMVMVDGTLYMAVRNAGNSQLAWSEDYGRSWSWAAWKWTTSFGCPTFLNFGKNYAEARDDFVYLYSPDSNSAYDPADRMVLARVKKNSLRVQDAYEYFAGASDSNAPRWTADIGQREAVFLHRGNCYRSGITYHAPLERYLWCQVLPESRDSRGPRFEGGFGIYEAPEPWGPWKTVFFTRHWDVGPGETCHFPTKWISDDGQGKTLYLAFSGDDCFSVRRATLITED